MQRAGSARITDAAWFPEIQLMRDQGLTIPQIASALNLSERRIRQIQAGGRMDGKAMVRTIPEAVAFEDLDPEFKPMMDFTADAFELFYNRFSAFNLTALHKSWVQAFIDNRNLLLNVPPRHAKSHIFSVWLPLWLITRNRNEQILLISKGKDLAVILSYEISWHLEFNTELISAFGRYAPERTGDAPWRPSRGEMLVLGRTRETKSGQLSFQSRGSGQQVLGMEATVVIVDDGTDAEISRSETERVKHMNWLREQVLTRIEPASDGTASGRAVVVGQRVHLRDMYGELADLRILRGPNRGQPTWNRIVMPAVSKWPEQGGPEVLWPEKWTFDELMETYERIGHNAFECMYQQNPLPEDAAFVRQDWLEGCRDYERPGGRGIKGDDIDQIVRVVSIDPSPTKYNALVVADVLASREVFNATALEFKVWKGGSRELQIEIERVMKRYNPEYIILESSTMTKWFEGEPYYQQLRHRVQVIAHQTGKNKGDPLLGVDSLAADIEAGRFRTPYGDASGRDMTEQFEFQASVYGHGYEFDLLMAVWFIKWNAKRLVPRGMYKGHFGGHQRSSWGYLARAREDKERKDQDKIVREWRKQNGRIPV